MLSRTAVITHSRYNAQPYHAQPLSRTTVITHSRYHAQPLSRTTVITHSRHQKKRDLKILTRKIFVIAKEISLFF